MSPTTEQRTPLVVLRRRTSHSQHVAQTRIVTDRSRSNSVVIFATLFQDANVDPLIRQLTLGHKPTNDARSALGMTACYSHSRMETRKREIERALRLWPEALEFASLTTNNVDSPTNDDPLVHIERIQPATLPIENNTTVEASDAKTLIDEEPAIDNDAIDNMFANFDELLLDDLLAV
jgi:hypothetical protein